MIPVAQLSMIRVILPLLELTVVMLPLLLSAVVADVSSLSAPTTSSSRVHPLNANANGMSKSMSTEMTVMSKLEALDFGAVVGLLGAACGAGRALFLL